MELRQASRPPTAARLLLSELMLRSRDEFCVGNRSRNGAEEARTGSDATYDAKTLIMSYAEKLISCFLSFLKVSHVCPTSIAAQKRIEQMLVKL